jgi:TPR repeat protein
MLRILALAIALLVLPAVSASGQDFLKGFDAFLSGDNATALREWTPLAEQGNARAQHNLGVMYDEGWGVPQNYKTAVKWWKLSAEQGDVDAQGNLGDMYANGQGLTQDNVYAHMWWNIAASLGHSVAAKRREIVAGKMTPAQIAEAQKLARECVAKNYKGC